jgi:hypothetical protein
VSDTHYKRAGELLSPMVDLFSGADGAAGFARLLYKFLPDILEMAADGDATAKDAVAMIEKFGKLCNIMLQPTVDKGIDL